MDKLFEERNFLERQDSDLQKKIFSFSKKNKRIGELKLSFYKRLKTAQEKEDIESIKKYLNILLRTIKLSKLIYQNIIKTLEEEEKLLFRELNEKEINDFFLQYKIVKQEIEKSTNQQQTFPLEEFKNAFITNSRELSNYIYQIGNQIRELKYQNSSSIPRIQEIIKQEEILFNDLISKNEDFLTKNIEEIQIHNLLLQEKRIEDEIELIIQKILKISSDFLKNNSQIIKDNKTLLEKLLLELEKDYQLSKKYANIPFEKLVEKGEILEKHASKFALTVVFLSGVSALSALFGVGIITGLFTTAFTIVATGGEMLQALPFVKRKIFPKLDLAINNLFTLGMHGKNNLKNMH